MAIVKKSEGSILKTSGLSNEVNEFRASFSPEMFSLITDNIYKNPVLAVIRELACNAYDAQVAAGNAHVPFKVKMPSALSSEFYIRDYGTGLSPDEIKNIYSVVFLSTKTKTNDQVGCFGIGSKSPFAICESFFVESVQNGKKWIYSMFMNEMKLPSYTCMTDIEGIDTDEPNGLKVGFSVPNVDLRRWYREANNVFEWFHVKPDINMVVLDKFEGHDKLYEDDKIVVYNTQLNEQGLKARSDIQRNALQKQQNSSVMPWSGPRCAGRTWNNIVTYANQMQQHHTYYYRDDNYSSGTTAFITMGNVGYRAFSDYKMYANDVFQSVSMIVVYKADIGEFQPTASRDTLRDSEEELREKIQPSINKAIGKIEKDFQQKAHKMSLLESFELIDKYAQLGFLELTSTSNSRSGAASVSLKNIKIVLQVENFLKAWLLTDFVPYSPHFGGNYDHIKVFKKSFLDMMFKDDPDEVRQKVDDSINKAFKFVNQVWEILDKPKTKVIRRNYYRNIIRNFWQVEANCINATNEKKAKAQKKDFVKLAKEETDVFKNCPTAVSADGTKLNVHNFVQLFTFKKLGACYSPTEVRVRDFEAAVSNEVCVFSRDEQDIKDLCKLLPFIQEIDASVFGKVKEENKSKAKVKVTGLYIDIWDEKFFEKAWRGNPTWDNLPKFAYYQVVTHWTHSDNKSSSVYQLLEGNKENALIHTPVFSILDTKLEQVLTERPEWVSLDELNKQVREWCKVPERFVWNHGLIKGQINEVLMSLFDRGVLSWTMIAHDNTLSVSRVISPWFKQFEEESLKKVKDSETELGRFCDKHTHHFFKQMVNKNTMYIELNKASFIADIEKLDKGDLKELFSCMYLIGSINEQTSKHYVKKNRDELIQFIYDGIKSKRAA